LATIGHIAAGLALSRASTPRPDILAIGVVTLAAILPDIDLLVGSNHRGPTHSIGFAVVTAATVYAILGLAGHRRARLIGVLAGAAVLSHIVLDLLTAQSPLAVLWPLTRREFSLPFLLLPAAPVGDNLLTARGIALAAAELAWSVAILLVAGWRFGRPFAQSALPVDPREEDG
jgi:membrane-bound metal-dependent hydrolase YbcI (DUF457 family)